MVQGRLFTGSLENSPEGTPLPSRGGFINPVLALITMIKTDDEWWLGVIKGNGEYILVIHDYLLVIVYKVVPRWR